MKCFVESKDEKYVTRTYSRKKRRIRMIKKNQVLGENYSCYLFRYLH